MTFISTYTGRRFYPLDPDPDDVCIEDIAHALAMICRFNGHTREFYSVAEHSIWVSYLVPEEYALAGLLHDASEAYVADVSRPVKHTAEFQAYRAIEWGLQRVLNTALMGEHDASYAEPVAIADNAMLTLEARSLLPYDPWMDELPEPADVALGLWGPGEAERKFLERYHALTQ